MKTVGARQRHRKEDIKKAKTQQGRYEDGRSKAKTARKT